MAAEVSQDMISGQGPSGFVRPCPLCLLFQRHAEADADGGEEHKRTVSCAGYFMRDEGGGESEVEEDVEGGVEVILGHHACFGTSRPLLAGQKFVPGVQRTD